MLQIAEQIRGWVEKYLDFTVTVGIGLAAGSEADISRSFHEAAGAVSRKVTLGVNRIIHTVETKDKADSEWFAYLEMIRSIIRKIRMLEQEWAGELELLFQEMAVHQLRKNDVERLLHYLVFQLEFELEGALPGEARMWLGEAKPELLLAMKQADTLKQLESCFTAALTRVAAHVEELALSRRHITLMMEVRDYVAAHYTDPNLSLTMLSDRFQINSKYLSQLFKESIGQNFLDFLIGLRIERAKQLLRESGQSVQDISEAVGYLNTTSFIRVFRKTVGLSPGQYRESQPAVEPERE
jgi:AraC-like DNA-binding protein